jgi:hypothetical protein
VRATLGVVRRAPRRRVRRRTVVEAVVIGLPPVPEVVDEAHEKAITHELALLLLADIEAEDRALGATEAPS